MSWTAEITDKMVSLYETGLSLSKIKDALNAEFGTAFSRSAVIGKTDRMRKSGKMITRVKPSAPRKASPRKAAGIRPRAGRTASLRVTAPRLTRAPRLRTNPKTAEVNANAVNDGAGVSLIDLADNGCRYPITDLTPGKAGELRFCGRAQNPDKPIHAGKYCDGHLDVTTTAPRTYGERAAIRPPRLSAVQKGNI